MFNAQLFSCRLLVGIICYFPFALPKYELTKKKGKERKRILYPTCLLLHTFRTIIIPERPQFGLLMSSYFSIFYSWMKRMLTSNLNNRNLNSMDAITMEYTPESPLEALYNKGLASKMTWDRRVIMLLVLYWTLLGLKKHG